MLSIPSGYVFESESPIIDLTEDKSVLFNLLQACHPMEGPQLNSLDELGPLLEVCDKYQIDGVMRSLGERYLCRHLEDDREDPFASTRSPSSQQCQTWLRKLPSAASPSHSPTSSLQTCQSSVSFRWHLTGAYSNSRLPTARRQRRPFPRTVTRGRRDLCREMGANRYYVGRW